MTLQQRFRNTAFLVVWLSPVLTLVTADTAIADADEQATAEAESAEQSAEEARKQKQREELRKARERQKKAVNAIKKLGGRVVIDYTQREVRPSPVVRVVLNHGDIGDQAMGLLDSSLG